MKKTLIDIIPVLVGILLALFISNWQQSKSEQSYIRNSVQAIINENKSNIAELENSINRQTAFLDTLRKYGEKEKSLYNIIRKANGLNTPDLKSTTWKFLIQDSKHTLVDYEFINKLAEIEKYEQLINRHNNKVLDMIYQPAFFDDPGLIKVCNVMIQDLMNSEIMLKKELEEFIEYAEEKY